MLASAIVHHLRRQMILLFYVLLFSLPMPLAAQSAEPDTASSAEENIAKLAEIEQIMFRELASAESESRGRQAEGILWEYWFNLAPTADARQLLDDGRARREAYDYEAAEKLFDQVVEQAPDYFEGYNQRAFARFLRENYAGALTDLETTLSLYPNHFGALSGMYHVLRIQGRHETAIQMLRKAVTIHPWIQERGALPQSLWPESYRAIHEPGQEI